MKRFKFGLVLALLQIVFMVLFYYFAEYEAAADARKSINETATNQEWLQSYGVFQNVHVMIFVGIGFLILFLKRYGFGAISLNFVVGAFISQWGIIVAGLFNLHNWKFPIGVGTLLGGDIAAAVVLISFGTVLGKVSPIQALIMGFIEVVAFIANAHVGLHIFKAVDVGGTMFIHVFACYFGLAVARVLYNSDIRKSSKEGSSYNSDIFTMIGTLFLWLFWPSFNAALAVEDGAQRAVINTYLAMASCCVTVFFVSSMLDKDDKFHMPEIQNATLAGGVVIGNSADLMVMPWGAVLIGMLAGLVSTLGYRHVAPWLTSKLKVHDTCGVHNLHGMTGIVGAIVGIVMTMVASEDTYGVNLYKFFPARAPLLSANSSLLPELKEVVPSFFTDPGNYPGLGRTASHQALYQAAALGLTLAVAIVSGLLTGALLKIPLYNMPKGWELFDDGPWFDMPADFQKEYTEPMLSVDDNLTDEEALYTTNSCRKVEDVNI